MFKCTPVCFFGAVGNRIRSDVFGGVEAGTGVHSAVSRATAQSKELGKAETIGG